MFLSSYVVQKSPLLYVIKNLETNVFFYCVYFFLCFYVFKALINSNLKHINT